ncbi:MAG: membrane protein insertion efficiency factor YidD [Candidatus Omnitrophica bacterium]|nr:membrane protein insertion efficiency factor YidD [Candidatus Omnitrophota bacterium]
MLKRFLLFCLDLYKDSFSALFPACRFYPSCSVYTKEAIIKRGLVKGLCKGIFRILRCHPLNPGGYDPLEKEG